MGWPVAAGTGLFARWTNVTVSYCSADRHQFDQIPAQTPRKETCTMDTMLCQKWV